MKSLTKSQYLIWAGQMLSSDAPLYNMPFRFDIKGAVDADIFVQAFHQLVKESDAMRTQFGLDAEELPVQNVEDRVGEIKVIDFSSSPDQEAEVQVWIDQKNARLFDISEILYESALLKLSDEHWIWYLNQHHLITDAWGISVQFNRIGEIYSALLKGQDVGAGLPPYSEYVDFEQGVRHSSPKIDYWKKQVQDAPALPSLYNFSEARLHSNSTRLFCALNAEQNDQLAHMILEPDVRSFTEHISRISIFMTTLMVYIFRVSGQRKITIGTPAHQRSTDDFKRTPGLFIEFFPIVTEIEKGETFGSLYQKVRNKVMSFLMNSGSGMASPEMSTTFNVVLNYIHAEYSDFAGMATDAEWLHIGHCDPRHDLRVHVMEGIQGMSKVMMDFNDVVFKGQSENVLDQFQAIFNAFLEDRSQMVDQCSIIKEHKVIYSSQKLNVRSSFEIHPEFQMRQGEIIGDHPMILQRVNDFRLFINENGIGEGDILGLYQRKTIDLVCSIYACLQSGVTYIPIPRNHPISRVESIAKKSGARGVLTDMEWNSNSIPVFHVKNVQTRSEKGSSSLLDMESSRPAYIMYTSGSTGEPKGVEISRSALSHYLNFAAERYAENAPVDMPLFTSIGFDLTVTSLFLPALCGGTLHIYSEPEEGPDLTVLDVAKNNKLTAIKWTPSHMEMVKDNFNLPALKTMIVGGEDFRTDLAAHFNQGYSEIDIINEYGPTEATVGTIIHRYHKKDHTLSVPIGTPIPGVGAVIVNQYGQVQPQGVSGELLLTGPSLANGYWKEEEKTNASFISLPDFPDQRFYKTGDLVYQDIQGTIHYQGRIDRQMKIGGRRIEPGEIAGAAEQLPEIKQAVVALVGSSKDQEEIIHCKTCGLPNNFPGVSFNEEDECSLCENFASYSERVKGYFKDRAALQKIFDETPRQEGSEYDCIMLLSGGKDSTYALAQLADMGLKVLAFTLDNGYISQGALDNAKRVCRTLGIDHVFGRTEAMNAIFVDSLKRYNNVCNGCFKVIYTLSTQIALEKRIPIIVTGLSRGQFFETRLTEELFWDEDAGPEKIDEIILNARKEYHRTEDAVSRLMDTDFFKDDDVFEKVKFVDFYRYNDVELGDLMKYLKEKLPWVRPSDTGRSTNCLINQLGIHIHKANVGYSNYAFPYSWDVRIGHKNRDESLDEINEEINVPAVEKIMEEIGYTDPIGVGEEHLTIFYSVRQNISSQKLKSHLESQLPHYMIPWSYVLVDDIPLTKNGKIDHDALVQNYRPNIEQHSSYVAPSTDFEIMVEEIWREVLLIDQIGVDDDFLHLGGNSLIAIRIISRINKKFRLDLGLNVLFKYPTVRQLAQHIEDVIKALLAG